MQEPLNYRGLRRWSMLILFPVLIVSAWVAALLMLMVTLPFTLPAFSAAAIAGVGIVGVAALIIPPVIGTLAGLWGIAFGKGQVVRAFSATRLSNDHPLGRVTHQMAARLGMPGPEVYVYPDEDVNAWATGTSASNAAVGISRGALNRLSQDHVHAVIGHELGHIAAADTRRLHFARSFQNALVWFFGFKSWRWNAQHIFGFVGQMGIMGMSRRREYWADAIGAILTSPETMRDALRAVERDATRPAKRRRYYNQLMFNWPGASLLSSHPTFSQRYAALDEGAFVASSLRKMEVASSRSSKPLQTRAETAQKADKGTRSVSTWFEQPWVEATTMVLAPVLFLSFGWYVWQVHQAQAPAIVVQQTAQPVEPVLAAKVAPEPAQGPRVAAWSRAEQPVVAIPPAIDDLADEPPGYRCFKVLDRRLPTGVTQAFDERKEWLVYAAATSSSEPALRELPNALRGCLKQSGGKLQSASSLENRKIEIWAFANETTCWFTPAAARAGSEPLSILGRCHSPED